MLEPLLTADEVSDYVRTNKNALYVQRHRGEGVGALAIKVGKRLLWRPSDIEAYLDEQARQTR